MRVAITADLHLTTWQEHPERFNALGNILAEMERLGAADLIVAGDIFDASQNNYGELEALCRDPKYRGVHFHFIRGNHDCRFGRSAVVSKNVTIYEAPALICIGDADCPFLFVPYEPARTMGERLAEFQGQLPPDRWILIGHGDWSGQLRTRNECEPGVYMPLTQRDIQLFRPAHAVLGHIHAPIDLAPVHYPGSPCPMDITETGRRRFLIYDTSHRSITPVTIPSDVIYFNETFTVLPLEDDLTHLEGAIRQRIASWDLSDDECDKVQIRVRVRGYCADRLGLQERLGASLSRFRLHKDEPPDITEVSIAAPGQALLAQRVQERIMEIDISGMAHSPDRDDIVLAALKLVYGEK